MFDLLVWYEIYVVILVVATVVLRFRVWRDLATVAYQFPNRWPRLFGVIVENKSLLFNRSTLLPIVMALTLAAVHTLCRHWLLSDAELSLLSVIEIPPALLLLACCGGYMLYLDYQVLQRSTPFQRAELEKRFNRGELALAKTVDWTVRICTLGFVSSTKIVEEQVTEALEEECTVVEEQMKGWLGRTIVRFAFGMTCWLCWAYIMVRSDRPPQTALWP